MASIILPNQLFENPVEQEKTYLIEHPKFFTDKVFHKQKLILHRASMKAYNENIEASYIEFLEAEERLEEIFQENEEIKMYDPVDHVIRDQFEKLAEEFSVELEFLDSPGFFASREWNKNYFEDHEYYQLSYYKTMRKRYDVLIYDDGGPVGGKWSFDPENRKKMPQEIEKPEVPQFSSEKVEKAKNYVEKHFEENPGEVEEFFWPTTRDQALENLDDFLQNRLEKFGDYQDAIDSDLKFGFHSLLSSSINIGLLRPKEVVEKTLEAHQKHDYPMNSLEGFLRQIIGWREFIRAMYQLEPDMREANFWDVDNDLPNEFYNAETGLPPVDDSIENAIENSYCHHIERLMVLGNVMLLLEVDPDQVYDWFMEMFIDSYEWVMVPNIYGMSQYSYENMMTKPYISSSNYINKMSHYDGGEWEDLWTGLYWNFINKHESKISDIQRMSFMTSTLDRMNEETVENHVENAKKFKNSLN